MKTSKKYLFALVSTVLATSNPIITNIFANESNIQLDNKKDQSLFTNFEGKITSIIKDNNNILVKVKNNNNIIDFIVNDNDDNILFLNSKGDIVKNELKKGQSILVSYRTNQITTMIYPPQYKPNVIMIQNDKNKIYNLKVDKFNLDKNTNKYLSRDNNLLISVDKNTQIVNQKNKKLEKIDGKEIAVLYDIATMSIPAQAVAKKIITLNNSENNNKKEEDSIKFSPALFAEKSSFYQTLLPKLNETEKNKLKNLNNVTLTVLNNNPKDISIKYKNDTIMLPIRDIIESLGYNVIWNEANKYIKVDIGNGIIINLGEDEYNIGKVGERKLKKQAPINIEGKTYVPIEFLNEILGINVEIKNNTINLK